MQRSTLSIAVLAVVAVALAGCTTPAQPPEDLTNTGNGTVPGTGGTPLNNTTLPAFKPPVARMQVFDAGGALVYEANFVADNVTAPAAVQGGAPIRFVGSPSEAVDKTATISTWEWTFGDGGRATGRSVEHSFPDTGGVYRVTLRVVDSNQQADVQVVTLGVHATRTFTEAITGTGSLQLGTAGNAGQDGVDAAVHTITLLDNVQGFPVEVEGLVLNVTPGEATSDFDIYLLDAEGEEVDSSANGPAPGDMEEMAFGPGELGAADYTLRVVLFLGAQGTYTVAGEVTYRVVNPQVEEMFGGHSH
jgi:predicted small secreted protein